MPVNVFKIDTYFLKESKFQANKFNFWLLSVFSEENHIDCLGLHCTWFTIDTKY